MRPAGMSPIKATETILSYFQCLPEVPLDSTALVAVCQQKYILVVGSSIAWRWLLVRLLLSFSTIQHCR